MQHVFQLAQLCFAGAYRRAFRQPQLDHQLEAVGGREELLLSHAHTHHPKHKAQNGRDDHGLAVLDALVHCRAENTIETAVINLFFITLADMRLEKAIAQERRHSHRRNPRHQQRDSHDREDRKGVFAGRRLGRRDWQKASRGDQCAGQHRSRRMRERIGGSAKFVPALFQLACHHLDRDHCIIHQQTQRNDQRTRGNPMQIDAKEIHQQEGRCQDKGNRQRHHKPGTQPQCKEADDQDDHHRLQQHFHKFADRLLDDLRLIGDLTEFDTDRQVRTDLFHPRAQVVTEFEHIAVIGHGHRQADRFLAVVVHDHIWRVLVITPHFSNIAQSDRTTRSAQRDIADVIDRGELAINIDRHGKQFRLHLAGRGHGVLAIERCHHIRCAEPQLGKTHVRGFDKDFVRPDPNQLNLGHIRHTQQLLAHVLNIAAQL